MLFVLVTATLGASDRVSLALLDRVPLARFDGATHRLDHKWSETNDPVMGGQSVGSCSVNASNATLTMIGAHSRASLHSAWPPRRTTPRACSASPSLPVTYPSP
eukprot:scaffold21785_cov103-Isochrysis_galbana.AAC.3